MKKVYVAVQCEETGKTQKLIGIYTNITILLNGLKTAGIDLTNSYMNGKRKSMHVNNLNLGKAFKTTPHITTYLENKPYIKIALTHLNEIYK